MHSLSESAKRGFVNIHAEGRTRKGGGYCLVGCRNEGDLQELKR